MSTLTEWLAKIDQGNHPAFRNLYGNNPATLARHARRYENLLQGFAGFSKGTDVRLYSSPGRTEIGGNHTDHNFGRVLAGAVNLDMVAAVAPNQSDMIRIMSSGYPVFEVNLDNLSVVPEEKYTSAALVRGICARFQEKGYATGGFDAAIDGEVPKGSGLSSSASFEVLVGAILSDLFNGGQVHPIQIAQIGQYAENQYFGKPCGLMDQTACAMGGLITIDFRDPSNPVVEKVDFDFVATGFSLVITDTGGNHADLNDEYASLPHDMKAVAAELGAVVLRQVDLRQVMDIAPKIRGKVGDRAILRAIHFQRDNQRVVDQVAALERNDFSGFLNLVVDSGYSSFMYNQNVFPVNNVHEQGVSIALALSDIVLKGRGAWRVHGGGFAGTIQAFVPADLLTEYVQTLEHFFGKGACHTLFIRPGGAGRIAI